MNTVKRLASLSFVLLFAGILNAATFDWNAAEECQPGIKVIRKKCKAPRLMRMAIMRIDLTTPGLRIVTTGRDADWGKPMPDCQGGIIATRRITTADFMKRANDGKKGGKKLMVAAFNASPWEPWKKPFTHKCGTPLGLNISNGILVSDNHPELPVFVVWKKGKVEIAQTVDRKHIRRIREAVSGFGLIAKGGKPVTPDIGYAQSPMPRMAYGLSRDRRYLYVIAIDGRQKKWSLGATGSETGKLLVEAGAWDAINMDGGGSATLCVWDRAKACPKMLNRQTENGYQRPVGSNVGIVLERSADR